MRRNFTIISVLTTLFIIISSSTAVSSVQSASIDSILERKHNVELLVTNVIDFDDLINLIIKILRFMQNLTTMFLTLLSPLVPILDALTLLLENILEKLEPWGILGQAILDVIESIYALIEAIKNIINTPQII